jgi:hypothetical protein
MHFFDLSKYQKLSEMFPVPLEILKIEFNKAVIDPRSNIDDVLDDTKWPPHGSIHGMEIFERRACAAVLFSKMEGFRTREFVSFSHGWFETDVVVVEKILH